VGIKSPCEVIKQMLLVDYFNINIKHKVKLKLNTRIKHIYKAALEGVYVIDYIMQQVKRAIAV
jgi:hypothetical protein